MKTDFDLAERLQEGHRRTIETPLFNPVFQLSLELSRLLEDGGLTLADCEALIADLECAALKSRAERLRRLVGPTSPSANDAALGRQLSDRDFEAYRERWQHSRLDVVFTAHPTFLLNPKQAAAVAEEAGNGSSADDDVCRLPAVPHQITLEGEHERAMQAIANAQRARDIVVARVLEHARSQWPDRWLDLQPAPFRFATWVGYDMDGRTDITWAQSIRFRLAEKAERLRGYAASLEAIDARHTLVRDLQGAADYAAERSRDFTADLSDPAAVSAAANRLTTDDPRKLLSLAGPIETLELEARVAPADRAVALKVLAAAMRTDGLGMGAIHFRVNAKQLHNAVRRRLDPAADLDLASKGAVVQLSRAIADARPLRSNFAALAIESSTAIRQFLAIAQIVRHIDADSPVRMLIAECEHPATVLAALYFAKLFGVADHVDVSPLFETESALEHGGRLLDAL
ncbi:MAG TPA: phosphoenolpyruvate carboxylase, partial [Croceibacterium sp.]|nr:phosphoenolpyruvate carboxylase [Croceibacterium sp.]